MNKLILVFTFSSILIACKDEAIVKIIDPIDPTDIVDTLNLPQVDCYKGKFQKPDIFFLRRDTSSGVARGYKNCYEFKANVFMHLDSARKLVEVGFRCYINLTKNISIVKEDYSYNRVPFDVGTHILKGPNYLFKVDDDEIDAIYKMDTTQNNFIKISSIDSVNRLIKGHVFSTYYVDQVFGDLNFMITEADTVRLEAVKFWAKY